MARENDKIPTSRVRAHGDRRDAGGRRGGEAVRHARGERDARRGGLRGGARAAPARDRQADRRRARDDEGRRHEARAGDVLPGRRARRRGAPRGVPARARQAARRGARRSPSSRCARVIEDDLEEPIARGLRRLRGGADRGRLDRAGLPGDAARDGREVAVKVQYPGVAERRARRHAEPGHDHARCSSA